MNSKIPPHVIFYTNLINDIKIELGKLGGDIKFNFNDFEMPFNNATKTINIVDSCFLVKALLDDELAGKLLNTNYIIITGEIFNINTNTYFGWEGLRNIANFEDNNTLMKILKGAKLVTFQDEKSQNLYRSKGINGMFFPLSYYKEEPLLKSSIYGSNETKQDIDILIYGHISPFIRRKQAISQLKKHFEGKREIYVTEESFGKNLSALLVRSKIILHINSLEECHHIPYAKIMHPLSINKVLLVENTTELETSNLINHIHTFDYYKEVNFQGNEIPDYVYKSIQLLENYEAEQDSIVEKNPSKYLKDNYNFSKLVQTMLATIIDEI